MPDEEAISAHFIIALQGEEDSCPKVSYDPLLSFSLKVVYVNIHIYRVFKERGIMGLERFYKQMFKSKMIIYRSFF